MQDPQRAVPAAIPDPRRFAPAALRNRDAILGVLRSVLPATGLVLEVASGSGEHALHFAAALPGLVFQPSDAAPAARASIDAWAAGAGLPNLRPALALDAAAAAADWPIARADALLCVNMIHIAPWEAALGLMAGAARLLRRRGRRWCSTGRSAAAAPTPPPPTPPSTTPLRAQDPRWGVRDLEAVAEAAAAAGFGPPEVVAMPANNLTLVFRRGPA